MDKFYNFEYYLRNKKEDTFSLTFKEIEDILGFKLTFSAYAYQAYWKASKTHTFPNMVLKYGYRMTPYLIDKYVVFSKSGKKALRNSLIKNQKPKNKKKDSVIVVRMYAGTYLDDNIGHEIINTFKTDTGDHFIYVNPWGKINDEFSDSKNILLVRGISADVWEVIGYATNLELLVDTTKNGIKNLNQDKLIIDRKIKYGGISIDKLMSDQTSVVYVTYLTREYHSVKKDCPLYLVANEKEIKGDNYILLPNTNFARQALHMYMDEERKKGAYDRLISLFKEDKWWDNDKCHSLGNLKGYNDSFNILDVIKRDEDELTFSNWLAYYLANDNNFLTAFAKDVLNININTEKSIVRREYQNIDIWIEDDNNIIVIENKIKSGINGVVEERHDFSKNEIKSQLSKYVKIASNEAKGRNTKFCLLIPDYGVSDDDLSIYKEYDKYLPTLRYSRLLAFLESHNTNLPYYDDYKKAVRKHASKYKKNLYEVMEERLINKIKKIKEITNRGKTH